jgi:hypothetical protein
MSNEIHIESHIGQKLAGKYKLAVIDSNNETVWEQPNWQKNLILNQGMDALYNNMYTDVMFYATMGNGTRVNSQYSDNSSGSVTSTTFTLTPGTGLQNFTQSVGGYNTILEVGDMVKFDDASEVRVLAVSPLSASVTPSSTISLQPFTIFKTSQVGLQNALHYVSNGNYFIGSGYCGSTTVGNVQQTRRTWDFNYETSSVIVTEVGVGWGASPSNIFSRVVLPYTVSLASAQKLRLIYELDITMLPSGSSPGFPFTGSITGWGTGSLVYGYYNMAAYYISGVDTNGNALSPAQCPIDPAGTAYVFVSPSSTPNADSGTPIARAVTGWDGAATTTSGYTPFSYTLYKTATFSTSQIVRNDLMSFGIYQSYNGGTANNNAFSCVMTENQTKTNVQTLTLTFVWNWGRTLA